MSGCKAEEKARLARSKLLRRHPKHTQVPGDASASETHEHVLLALASTDRLVHAKVREPLKSPRDAEYVSAPQPVNKRGQRLTLPLQTFHQVFDDAVEGSREVQASQVK